MKGFIGSVVALICVTGVLSMPNGCAPPPNMKNPMECCDTPMPVDGSVFDSCLAKHGPPRDGPGPKPGCCIAECVFNSTNVVKNGEIDVAAFKTYMNTRNNGITEWNAVFDKVIDECLAESTKNPLPQLPPSANPEDNCNPKYGMIGMCLKSKLFTNCPSKVYKQSAECDDLKKYSEKCPLMPKRK